MIDLETKIQSIRDTIGGSYVKPSNDRVGEYITALGNTPTALDYLTITRGLTPDTIAHFRLGYSPERNAITIPIYKRGDLVNIRYRHLDENAKAKYTQEKGAEVWLFNEEGISLGQTKGGVLVVEGEFDCMACWQAGFKNVVSPASGKDSYGVWLELLDTIPKVYVSYDNDKPGKTAALNLAERIGTDKSFEVQYPMGCKDASDYFKLHTAEEYKDLIRSAQPFYKHQFKGLGDVITVIREKTDKFIKLDTVPFIEWEDGYVAVCSGMSNIGKTSYSMNIANELVEKDIPCLVLPIERGIKDVGKRFLQVRYNKSKDELRHVSDEEWEKIIPDVVAAPLYFSIPKIDDVEETIKKAHRLFNTKFIIVDHLDLFVRKSEPKNYNIELANTIQKFKRIAQELDIMFIIVHHIKKQEGVGSVPKKPRLEDLKGNSATYQDPEAVIMLSEPEKGQIEVDILKNKGTMGSRIYEFNLATGKMGLDITVQQGRTEQGALDYKDVKF